MEAKELERKRPELFNVKMKISDMIDANCGLLYIFPRLGMEVKYANLSVSEACQKCNIDATTFILICNVYTFFNDYIPSAADIAEAKMEDIIRYLHNSHSAYIGLSLTDLSNAFMEMISPCNEQQKGIVVKFISDYKQELHKHFSYEEDVVFPYVSALAKGEIPQDYSIDNFKKHHENIIEKLDDLKNIVMKYLPPICEDEMRTRVLLAIYHLKDDLSRHTYVEDCILVPVVTRVENYGR